MHNIHTVYKRKYLYIYIYCLLYTCILHQHSQNCWNKLSDCRVQWLYGWVRRGCIDRFECASHIMIKSNHKIHRWGKILTTTLSYLTIDITRGHCYLTKHDVSIHMYIFTLYGLLHVYLSIYISYIYIYVSISALYQCVYRMRGTWTWIVSAKLDTFTLPKSPQTKIQR